jgi:hypothetical protein
VRKPPRGVPRSSQRILSFPPTDHDNEARPEETHDPHRETRESPDQGRSAKRTQSPAALSDDSHLVPADLAPANRQLDPSVALIGHLAALLQTIDLVHFAADASTTVFHLVAFLELDIEFF